MSARVLVVGSLSTDLVVRCARHPAAGETVLGDSFARQPGGKGADRAVAAARQLGPGRLERPAHRVESVDTTGAGDAFCGALVGCLAEARPESEALARACAAGAPAVTRRGDMPSLPSGPDVENLLSGRSGAVGPASWAAPRP